MVSDEISCTNLKLIENVLISSIHSFAISLILYWVFGELGPIPSNIGQEASYTLDRSSQG